MNIFVASFFGTVFSGVLRRSAKQLVSQALSCVSVFAFRSLCWCSSLKVRIGCCSAHDISSGSGLRGRDLREMLCWREVCFGAVRDLAHLVKLSSGCRNRKLLNCACSDCLSSKLKIIRFLMCSVLGFVKASSRLCTYGSHSV